MNFQEEGLGMKLGGNHKYLGLTLRKGHIGEEQGGDPDIQNKKWLVHKEKILHGQAVNSFIEKLQVDPEGIDLGI